MKKSKHCPFALQEETKCPLLPPKHCFPSLAQLTLIEVSINEDTYFISKDDQMFPILYSLLRPLSMTTVQKNTIISVALPHTLSKAFIETYFQYLTSSSLPQLELPMASQLVSLCLFFEDKDTLTRLIQCSIEPIIDKHTAIEVVSLFFQYTTHKSFGEMFSEIVTTAIGLVSANMFFIISNMRDAFLQLEEKAFERIITFYFQSVLFNPSIDHSLVMSVLMAKRDINDVFELLENERKDSISQFESLLSGAMKPSLEWTIQIDDPSAGLYIESDEFAFDSIDNQIITYYDCKQDAFNIALKIIHIKDEEDITFSQQRFRANDKEDNSDFIDALNSKSNQFIISLLSLCEIPELDLKLKINFNCIFSNSQTKVLIARIENFKLKFTERQLSFNCQSVFTLRLFFSISYNFSSILTHICKNFYQYHSLSSVGIIPKNVLNIILRNEELSIQSEDEMLLAVQNWLIYRNNQSSELLIEIARNINWALLSVEGLFGFIQSQGKLILGAAELQKIIVNEINGRFKKDYYIDEDSFTEAKANIRRKYIPTSKCNSKNNFSFELLMNILKLLSKPSAIPQSQSSMSNSISAIYRHEDSLNRKVSMNHSAQELTNGYSFKSSMRNTQEGGSFHAYEHQHCINANSTHRKHSLVPMSNIDNVQYYTSERLRPKHESSSNNRNKLISSLYSNKSNVSESSHRESYLQSKPKKAKNNPHKDDKCPNSGLYPHYIKSVNHSKALLNKPSHSNHPNASYINKKRKIANLIKTAKRESKENMEKRLKRTPSTLNSSAKNINSNYIKFINRTRAFLE